MVETLNSHIAISATNFTEGGPLSILNQCIKEVGDSRLPENHQIHWFISNLNFIEKKYYKNFVFHEHPLIPGNYFRRLKGEFIDFFRFSEINPIKLWLSLHDVTPRVKAHKRAVYCHNPSPFAKLPLQLISKDPKFYLFSRFYKFIYRLNIKKNDYVITQQNWMAEEFSRMFNIPDSKIIVASPNRQFPQKLTTQRAQHSKFTFFYPAFPRVFKNFEDIIRAVRIIEETTNLDFEVLLTIDGSENKYSNWLKRLYPNSSKIKYCGRLTFNEVQNAYLNVDCLLFPSRLETWGLPLSEFRTYLKPIIASNLAFAKETLSGYEKAALYQPGNYRRLSELMILAIAGKIDSHFTSLSTSTSTRFKKTENWTNLIERLLAE